MSARGSTSALAVLLASTALGVLAQGALAQERAPLLVAAASDLRPAFSELGAKFSETTGTRVEFDFGSSGQLAQRIIEGAPVDVFASADIGFVDRVLSKGRGDAATRATYAFGRITIWSRRDAWHDWTSLEALAGDPSVRILAIANPEHAPYGRAAKEAFAATETWEKVQPRLVYGENVADTQRLAASGNADAAIVALSLAIAAGDTGRWTLVPEKLHTRLEQVLVVIATDPARARLARAFVALVNGAGGRVVMRRYGLLLPGEQVAGKP